MKKHTIHAEVRTQFGRKVKQMRGVGKIPATIYGKKVDSMSLVVEGKEIEQVFRDGGESSLVELLISKEGKEDIRPVLVHNIQHHPVTGIPVHIEFYQVNLKEKVTSNIPLHIIGEAPAIVDKLGVLLTLAQTIDVEALPTDLPEHIDVDVSTLLAVGDEISVSKLIMPSGVTIISDPQLVVVRVSALVQKEKVEEVPVVAVTEGEPTAEPTIITEEKKDKEGEEEVEKK
jgi:large subunit ribosomal protein L25